MDDGCVKATTNSSRTRCFVLAEYVVALSVEVTPHKPEECVLFMCCNSSVNVRVSLSISPAINVSHFIPKASGIGSSPL